MNNSICINKNWATPLYNLYYRRNYRVISIQRIHSPKVRIMFMDDVLTEKTVYFNL